MAPLTVDDVIDNARDLHPLLSRENVADELMVRELTRAVSDIYDQIYPRMPAYLSTTLDIDLTDPGFDWAGALNDVPGESPGIDLSTLIAGGWKDLTQGEFWKGSGATARCLSKATPTPWEQRTFCARFPAFTLRNNALYFLGQQVNYSRFSLFRIIYTPSIADLTLGGNIALPRDAREPLASRLAVFGLMRLVGNPQFKISQQDIGPIASRASSDRSSYLTAIFRTAQKQRHVMRDTNPAPGGPFGPGNF